MVWAYNVRKISMYFSGTLFRSKTLKSVDWPTQSNAPFKSESIEIIWRW